jgi:hypothetical protein
MWLMARVIKSMGIKMVLSGEGLILLEGICISTKPPKKEFHENVRKLETAYV